MVFLPMQLEIYDKPDEQLKTEQLPELSERTALEEQIAKGRRLVWKHSDKMKVFITRFSCVTFNSMCLFICFILFSCISIKIFETSNLNFRMQQTLLPKEPRHFGRKQKVKKRLIISSTDFFFKHFQTKLGLELG